jgi:replicative DNA helicase
MSVKRSQDAKKEAQDLPETPEFYYEDINWNDPQIFKDDEDLHPEFPLETMPPTFRQPIEEVMRHYKVNALLPVACALVINSAAIGRGLMVKSNVKRTYANIYSIIAAKSGTGKSNVFDEFMVPLNKLQFETLKEFNAEQKPRAEAELKLLQQEIQSLLKHKKNSKEFDLGEDARHERLCELLQQQAVLEDKLEFASRLWCVDFTSEALGMLLASSKEQIAVLTDEGGLPLYNMLGRYTKGDVTDDILLCKAKTVNSHSVDRVGRAPIVLSQPCISLLLLVQPDLLRKAFGNERLLVGGFLARCLAADAGMEIQYEDENTIPEPDENVMKRWGDHICSLVKTFRFADDSYSIAVDPEVRKASRKFHNEIVDQVRDALWDISTFAMRWVERAWEISLNLHAGIYGVECYRQRLSAKTFSNAVSIARFFAARQLVALQAPRIKAHDEMCDRLKTIFSRNEQSPITLRDLRRRHGLNRDEVIKSVKSNPETFGVAIAHSSRGGSPSTLVFLQTNPPVGMKGATRYGK